MLAWHVAAQTVVSRFFQPANGNDLVILHIHKDRTDSLRLDEIGNDFIDIGKKQE